TFYDLPCNYPPSPSQHGHHRCIAGMGTPDMLGSYGTYQLFAQEVPPEPDGDTGRHVEITFEGETAKAELLGPSNSLLREPSPIKVEFLIHRDVEANAAVIEIQGRRVVLRAGDWSRWTKIDFHMSTPWFMPGKSASGICRFYLQKVAPKFQLYVSPVNIDPS